MSRALVISGGGSKGAYAVGALQQLKLVFPTIEFQSVVGTSTGALIAPFAALGAFDVLERLYTTVKTDDVIIRHRLGDRINNSSIFTVEPLWKLIQANITNDRYQRILDSGKGVYIVTVNLQTADIVVFTNNDVPGNNPSVNYSLQKIVDAEHFRLAVLASACQPVFMTPVKVNFNYRPGSEQNHQFVDGGVREYAGVQIAMDQGATHIFTILLSSRELPATNQEFQQLFPILQRTISTFSTDVEKNDIAVPAVYTAAQRYLQVVKRKMLDAGISPDMIEAFFRVEGPGNIFERERPIKMYTIRPDKPLGGGPGGLTFDPAEMQQMLMQGRGDAQALINNLPPGEIA